MKALLPLAVCIALTGCTADAKPVIQGELFYVNETEKTLSQWVGLSLTIEGYPIAENAYHWELTNPDEGFSDDGTREVWSGAVTVLDSKKLEIARFNAVCETSKIDIGQAVVGGLCDMQEL